jgi:hypothetical protein
MILDVISYLDDVLYNDPDIAADLSIYLNGPAIAFQSAPQDMVEPYIVTSSAANAAEGNYVTDRSAYSVDIYCPDGDTAKAGRLAKRVIELLNMTRLPVDIGLNIWKEWDNFIPEPNDPSVIRYHIEFGLRHI